MRDERSGYPLTMTKNRLDHKYGHVDGSSEHYVASIRFWITYTCEGRSATVKCACGRTATARLGGCYEDMADAAIKALGCPITHRDHSPFPHPEITDALGEPASV